MIGIPPLPPQRFPAAAALAFLIAAACSGGGGGGPSNAAPVLVTAAFVGASATPAFGETLILTFSEEITLAGALLSDADVTLTAGATLGAVSLVPTQLSANTVSVQLGVGVAFEPGTTTITLKTPGNDAVRDTSGNLGAAGTPVVIGTSDGSVPVIANVTVAAVDDALNGTGPAGGVLQVPANGWTIDLAYSDNSAIATVQTQISASAAVQTPAGTQQAGTNLLPFLTTIAATNTTASYRVPGDVAFPNSPVTLTIVIADVSGLGSSPATYSLTVRAFTAALQPFETTSNPSQVWFLDFTRDVESYGTAPGGAGVAVSVLPGANAQSDFEEILLVLGLTSATPIPNVQGANNSNQVVIERYKQALLAELAALFAGANVQFTLTPPGGSFGGASSIAYNSFPFSQISIAGASLTAGVLGIAIFDPNNATQNDDTRLDFQGSRLGVFLHTIVDSGLQSPSTSLFRLTYGAFAPAAPISGTPIGNDASDGDRLTGALTDGRAAAIDTAIADLARFTSIVTAHECGHSMGLVFNGAMPNGLYGDDGVNFPGSSEGHIRNAALFPAGSTNVMSPSLSYSATINPASGFNSLNLAYLREQVFYGN